MVTKIWSETFIIYSNFLTLILKSEKRETHKATTLLNHLMITTYHLGKKSSKIRLLKRT